MKSRTQILSVKSAIKMGVYGNRDGVIDFDEKEDRELLFWVNDDCDEKGYDWQGVQVEDDEESGSENSGNDKIDCLRDLEDFSRINIEIDKGLSKLNNLSYYFAFENTDSTNPAINLFEGVEDSTNYLFNQEIAENQLKKEKIATISTAEVEITSSKYSFTAGKTHLFLFEGKHKGKGSLVFIIKQNSKVIAKTSVKIVLKKSNDFIQGVHYNLDTKRLENIKQYNPSEEDKSIINSNDILVYIHGYNMVNEWEKIIWAETIFKRLYWLGYKGHVGYFSWRDDTLMKFNKSEISAFKSGEGLNKYIQYLYNQGYKIHILAHSQGNIVMSEALRQMDESGMVSSYVSSQAAVSAGAYDNSLPCYLSPDKIYTPDLLGHYYSGTSSTEEYFHGNNQKVEKRINCYNLNDYAIKGWQSNNGYKPLDLLYSCYYKGNINSYTQSADVFYILTELVDSSIQKTDLFFEGDRYTIFAYGVQSRTLAMGQLEMPECININLAESPYNYQDLLFIITANSSDLIIWKKVFIGKQ